MIKPRIGISIGDVNGIGLEVILKTILPAGIVQFCTPVIYANSKTVAYHRNALELPTFEFQSLKTNAENLNQDMINIVNCWEEAVEVQFGKMNETGGKYAMKSLESATDDLIAGHIDALVTAPIHKQAMQMAGFKHVGHTEYLTEKMGASQQVMLLCEEGLRVGLVTNHLPVGEVAAAITKELVLEKIQILYQSLRKDFGIDKPKIAVLGLNPHAGDGGVLGSEEATQILPAIDAAKAAKIMAFGPYPADGFFGSGNYKNFDAILAMYHDQGLAPFKALSFGRGVNYTAGLSRIRTSPDHGTGHDIAGMDKADENSFRQALFLAIDMVRERAGYDERYGNPLKRHELSRERY
jgi:4-hydroxythreonine-4-phosphate dehydrogenase